MLFRSRIAGLDFAAFFAVFTAVAMIIPYFGALISSIPPILYALTVSPSKAVIVAVIVASTKRWVMVGLLMPDILKCQLQQGERGCVSAPRSCVSRGANATPLADARIVAVLEL